MNIYEKHNVSVIIVEREKNKSVLVYIHLTNTRMQANI